MPYSGIETSWAAFAFAARFLLEALASAPPGPMVTGVKVIDGVVTVPSTEGLGILGLLGGGCGYGSPRAAYSAVRTSISALLGRPRFFLRWSAVSIRPGGYAVASVGSLTVTKPGFRG